MLIVDAEVQVSNTRPETTSRAMESRIMTSSYHLVSLIGGPGGTSVPLAAAVSSAAKS